MSHLREQFEQETGLIRNNCTGIGDYSGLHADSEIDAQYIQWLEGKAEKLIQLPAPHRKGILQLSLTVRELLLVASGFTPPERVDHLQRMDDLIAQMRL